MLPQSRPSALLENIGRSSLVSTQPQQTINVKIAAQESSSQFAYDNSYSLQPFTVDTRRKSADTCMHQDATDSDTKWCSEHHHHSIAQPRQTSPDNIIAHNDHGCSGSKTVHSATGAGEKKKQLEPRLQQKERTHNNT